MAVQLVVQGDDAGMCHAVNEAIVAAFEGGILTRMSVMAPCPWFAEAAALAVPAGLHVTLTCEWDHLRWSPLTDGRSLTEADGTMHRTVEAARRAGDPAEVRAELDAQLGRFLAAGLTPTHVDPHMGAWIPPSGDPFVTEAGVPFVYDGTAFASTKMLSARPASEKVSWLLHHLETLGPGKHFLCTHPGLAGAELSGIAGADAANRPWADEYRVSDLATLCAPEVREAIDRLGIELVAA